MLKKILFLGASVALAFTATTATAGGTVAPPTYAVAPLSGSIKLVGITEGTGNSKKFVKITGDSKKLIRVALNRDPNAKPLADEKNYVLGLANADVCGAEIVVWDKLAHVVKAEIALITPTDCDEENPVFVNTRPADGKSGTSQEYFTLNVKFVGPGQSCGTLATGETLDGGGYALGLFSEKITFNSQEPQNPTETPTSLSITNVIGDLNSEDDDHTVIVGGSFKADFAASKKLGTSAQPIRLTCPAPEDNEDI